MCCMIYAGVYIQNLQPNHRGNDVLVMEDKKQQISAKFMYGPLDMTSLSGEKVGGEFCH